jgi:hypothetical protein
MRRRVNCTIDATNNTIIVAEPITIDDIRLIVDEAQMKVICSSMQKSNVDVTTDINATVVVVPTSICTLAADDHITFEIDTADNAHADHLLILETYEGLVENLKEREKLLYSAHFEDNTDGDNTYTMVLPVIAGVNATTETVTTTTD